MPFFPVHCHSRLVLDGFLNLKYFYNHSNSEQTIFRGICHSLKPRFSKTSVLLRVLLLYCVWCIATENQCDPQCPGGRSLSESPHTESFRFLLVWVMRLLSFLSCL